MQLTKTAATTLQSRGFTFSHNFTDTALSPAGLRWLLNHQHQHSGFKPDLWAGPFLRRLADFAPDTLRGLNLQAVKLSPYGNDRYTWVLAYLDKTPPSPMLLGCLSQGTVVLTGNPALNIRYGDSFPGNVRLTLTDAEVSALLSGTELRIT